MAAGYRKILTFAAVFLGIYLAIRYLLPIFLPFILGAALALAAEPMAAFFCARGHVPRAVSAGISVSMAFCFVALAFLLLGALLVREVGLLAGILPDLEETARSGMASLSQWLQSLTRFAPGGLQSYLSGSISEFFSSGTALLDKAASWVLSLAGGLLSRIPDSALGLGTALISSYMISAKLPKIRSALARLTEKTALPRILPALKRMRSALGGWLLAQLKLSGVTWATVTLGFVLLRIPYAPLWAFLVALVDAFPILGTGTALVPWSIICFLQDQQARAIGLLGIYGVVALTRSILEPRLVGRQLGLDPLVTLFALYAGYKLWGFGGMLLAPMLAVAGMHLLPDRGQA